MAQPQMIVLIFSKYSELCGQLINMIQSSGVDIAGETGMVPLCIDKQKIRQKVMSDRQLGVTTVPSLIIAYSDGTVEKYDGIMAVNWVQNVIQNLTAMAPPVQQPQPTQQTQPQPVQQPQQPQQPQPQVTQIQLPQSTEISPNNQPEMINQPNVPGGLQGTSIEDLPFDDDDELAQGAQRASEFLSQQRQSSSAGRNDEKSRKAADITNRAQNIAKEREMEDKKFTRPGAPSMKHN